MFIKRLLILFAACEFAVYVHGEGTASYSVVPLPQEIKLSQDNPFRLDDKVVVVYPESNPQLRRNAEFLSEYIGQSVGFVLPVKAMAGGEKVENAIVLALTPQISNKEGYQLSVSSKGILIEGQTEKGVFYGIQTLRKSIPIGIGEKMALMPTGIVKDEPRFVYRGMHLDVARHFFTVEFVKKYIDLLALHNMNTFHWHLTDDQGWRIEIKKYPKLVEVGSVRNRTVIGYLGSGEYDNTSYGGYYTQEQIKEVVRYAEERYINIIPEVDLPGHMLAALAAYLELGCTGGPYEVCPDWGVFEDVLCIGNEKTMQFLEDVMTELIEIFPSKYIHIGGDEAPRIRWKECPKCQRRIIAEGLKADEKHSAEDRLQSYCMQRIEKFLNARGKQIIGWDEILEGDVAPNATVMSWRGSAGGIKAAKMGHNVVMAPNTHCYFDFYQTGDTENEPLSIGGCLTVEKVYSLEPTEALTAEQAEHILGVQANLWTEYISSAAHAEYMVLPRMAALAEVQWTKPEKKDYGDFTKRIVNLLALYQRNGWNYAKHLYDIKADFTPDIEKKAMTVTLSTIDNAPIYYTLDGKEPSKTSRRYTVPVSIDSSADFRATVIRSDSKNSCIRKTISFNKATLLPVTLTQVQPAPDYTFGGAATLVDGMAGNDNFSTGAWLGFLGEDVTVLIDLKQQTEISRLSINAMTYMDAWIMGPVGLQVFISDDNEQFVNVADEAFPAEADVKKRCIEKYDVTFAPVNARYVKLVVKGSMALPKGHVGEGKMPYLFMDEIQID